MRPALNFGVEIEGIFGDIPFYCRWNLPIGNPNGITVYHHTGRWVVGVVCLVDVWDEDEEEISDAMNRLG